MPASRSQKTPKSFEQAMQELDAIVAKLEEDQLPLEEMLASYEEGISLASFCGKKLEVAEQKVRLIAQKDDGSIALEEFYDGKEG
jgi:exodeoxyribonuclease VII small subunit